MAKKNKNRKRRKFSILSAVAAIGHALPGTNGNDSPISYAAQGNFEAALEAYVRNITGYGWYAGKWDFKWLCKGWAPTVISLIAKKAIGYFGLNRYMQDMPFNF